MPADLLADTYVVRIAGTEPAMFRGDAQRVASGAAEVCEVLERERGVAVVPDRPLGERGTHRPNSLHQLVAIDRHGQIVVAHPGDVNTVDKYG